MKDGNYLYIYIFSLTKTLISHILNYLKLYKLFFMNIYHRHLYNIKIIETDLIKWDTEIYLGDYVCSLLLIN